MQVKGSRPACVEAGDAACERPSVCFHRPAAGGLILSHPDVIDAELQPGGTSQRARLESNTGPQKSEVTSPCRAPGSRQIVPPSVAAPPV